MDRANLILEALASRGANVDADASDAATSAYAELKGLVQRCLDGHADAESALQQYEARPDEGGERLKEALDSTGAIGDFEIVSAAQTLMKLVDPEGAAAGRYSVQPRSLPGRGIGH